MCVIYLMKLRNLAVVEPLLLEPVSCSSPCYEKIFIIISIFTAVGSAMLLSFMNLWSSELQASATNLFERGWDTKKMKQLNLSFNPEALPAKSNHRFVACQPFKGSLWLSFGPLNETRFCFRWNTTKAVVNLIKQVEKDMIKAELKQYASLHGVPLEGDNAVKIALLTKENLWVSNAGGISTFPFVPEGLPPITRTGKYVAFQSGPGAPWRLFGPTIVGTSFMWTPRSSNAKTAVSFKEKEQARAELAQYACTYGIYLEEKKSLKIALLYKDDLWVSYHGGSTRFALPFRTGIMSMLKPRRGFGVIKPDGSDDEIFCKMSGFLYGENSVKHNDPVSYVVRFHKPTEKMWAWCVRTRKEVVGLRQQVEHYFSDKNQTSVKSIRETLSRNAEGCVDLCEILNRHEMIVIGATAERVEEALRHSRIEMRKIPGCKTTLRLKDATRLEITSDASGKGDAIPEFKVGSKGDGDCNDNLSQKILSLKKSMNETKWIDSLSELVVLHGREALQEWRDTALLHQHHIIHLAVQRDFANVLKQLVKEYGFDINAPRASDACTPMHLAIWYNKPKAIQALAELGADLSLKNSFNESCGEQYATLVAELVRCRN